MGMGSGEQAALVLGFGATMTTTTYDDDDDDDGACGELCWRRKYEFPRSLGAVDLAGEKLKYNIAKINA